VTLASFLDAYIGVRYAAAGRCLERLLRKLAHIETV
jgi:hypothetical protein